MSNIICIIPKIIVKFTLINTLKSHTNSHNQIHGNVSRRWCRTHFTLLGFFSSALQTSKLPLSRSVSLSPLFLSPLSLSFFQSLSIIMKTNFLISPPYLLHPTLSLSLSLIFSLTLQEDKRSPLPSCPQVFVYRVLWIPFPSPTQKEIGKQARECVCVCVCVCVCIFVCVKEDYECMYEN